MNRIVLACIKVFMLAIALPAFALQITGVSTDILAFDPSKGESVAITFHLDQPANVVVAFYDARDLLVKTIELGYLPKGDQTARWDGRNQQGKPVPPEAYRYAIKAKAADQSVVEYDLTDITGGEKAAAPDLKWQAEEGVISYVLTEPSRVVIRVGLKNHGPLMKTVVDWVPRLAGVNQEKWDGWDESKVLDLNKHPNLELALDAFTLPKNTILVKPYTTSPQFIAKAPNGVSRVKTQTKGRRAYDAFDIPAEQRGDFPMQLKLAGNYPSNGEGIPIVSGAVPVRLNVNSSLLERISSQRFEPVFFIDGQYVFENEVGFFPMTYMWDSDKHNEGEHYITANLRGYRNNFGMATIKVIVRRQQK